MILNNMGLNRIMKSIKRCKGCKYQSDDSYCLLKEVRCYKQSEYECTLKFLKEINELIRGELK